MARVDRALKGVVMSLLRTAPVSYGPFGLLLATGSLLGLSTTLAKLAVGEGITAPAYLAWSCLGAGLVLLGAGIRRGLRPLRLSWLTAEYLAVAALVSVAGPNLLFFLAIPHVGAGFVALAMAFPPLFTYVGARLLALEGPSVGRSLGVGVALAGVLALVVPRLSPGEGVGLWLAAPLLGAALLAVGNLYRTVRWPSGATPESLAVGMLLGAGLLLLPLGLALPGSLAIPMDRAAPALLVTAQAAVFALQYLLFFNLQRQGGPVLLSLLGSVGALVGVPLAVSLLHEPPPPGLALGAVLSAAGIALVVLGGRRPALGSPTTPILQYPPR